MPYKNKEQQRKAQREYARKKRTENLEKTNKRKQEIKDWFNDYKSDKSCSSCGENHPACLEFHHINENDKYAAVSYLVQKAYSLDKIKSEISKCKILCANCHRKLHFNESSGSHSKQRHTKKNILSPKKSGMVR